MNQFQTNVNPKIQVIVVDKTPSHLGRVLMGNLRDPAHPTRDQRRFVTRSRVGLMEVNIGGWETNRRSRNVTRIYCVLQKDANVDLPAIYSLCTGIPLFSLLY